MSSPGQLGPLLPYPCVPGLSVPFLPSASTAMHLLVRIPALLSLELSAARQKCCAVTLSCAHAGLSSLPAVSTVLQTLLSCARAGLSSLPLYRQCCRPFVFCPVHVQGSAHFRCIDSVVDPSSPGSSRAPSRHFLYRMRDLY